MKLDLPAIDFDVEDLKFEKKVMPVPSINGFVAYVPGPGETISYKVRFK